MYRFSLTFKKMSVAQFFCGLNIEHIHNTEMLLMSEKHLFTKIKVIMENIR